MMRGTSMEGESRRVPLSGGGSGPGGNQISLQDPQEVPVCGALAERFRAVRGASERHCAPLEPEDYCIQPMADASPPKWHLAHVTWFFETFLLKPFVADYAPFHSRFEYLFNSYYNGVGRLYPRAHRGLLSRPTTREIIEYRRHVDRAMLRLLGERADEDAIAFRTELGLHHEQQHQELFFTDMKYNLGNNPLHPLYVEGPASLEEVPEAAPLDFVRCDGGVREIGFCGEGFHFDNEGPRHEVLVRDYALANRPVTNGEFLDFLEDGGYTRSELWLSDGWATINEAGIGAPLYWYRDDGEWFEYHLDGARPLQRSAPVCHVSGYEAAAYARWAGARLPSEPEWELAATMPPADGNFVESGLFRPRAANVEPVRSASGPRAPAGMFGDVWEWTSSSYAPYPGFSEFEGSLGEYNGKFMANQLVLRGGSCVTPASHIRATYRNFFYPKDRWQFTGIRLARD